MTQHSTAQQWLLWKQDSHTLTKFLRYYVPDDYEVNPHYYWMWGMTFVQLYASPELLRVDLFWLCNKSMQSIV